MASVMSVVTSDSQLDPKAVARDMGLFTAESFAVMGAAYLFVKPVGDGKDEKTSQPSKTTLAAVLLYTFSAIKYLSRTPIGVVSINESAMTQKLVDNFSVFYKTVYLKGHEELRDKIVHCIIFFSTLVYMVSDPRKLVSWLMTLSTGALLTRPLLKANLEWVEALAMVLVASCASLRYRVFVPFMSVYSIWLSSDAASHLLFGENLHFALFAGKYYLSWALLGQAKLVLQIFQGKIPLN